MLHQKLQNKTNNEYELRLLSQGFKRVIGIDEAGRGCWAGPVAVGAFEYDLQCEIDQNITDSKLIKENKRLEIFKQIDPKRFFVAYGSVEEIDSVGIAKIIEIKIKEIIDRYNNAETYFIIDGMFSRNFGPNTEKIIKGDLKHYAIASASIAAKVSRDLLMYELDNKYPQYCFGKHKGYGTALHLSKLKQYGLTDIHRLSFSPMRQMKESGDAINCWQGKIV